MVHGSRGAVLLALSTTSIALFGVAAGSASAMSRATSAPDAKGDLVDQGEDPTPGSTTDPSRDIVSVSYNYNASGRVELSATMAAPVNPAQAPLAVDFTLNGPDANGHCQRGGAANQLAVRVDTSGHSGPAKLTVVKHFAIGDSTGEDPIPAVQQIDGTHVNAVVTSDKLANLDYVCLVVTSYATTSQNTGPPVDTAAAQIDGYFYQPGRESWTIGELRTPIQPKDKAAKIATILKSGGYEFWFGVPWGIPGIVKYAWTSRHAVVASMSSKVPFGALAGLKYHLKLTKAGKALLKRTKKSISLTATGSFTPDHFKAITVSQKITLKH
jgi:hypothetical protein